MPNTNHIETNNFSEMPISKAINLAAEVMEQQLTYYTITCELDISNYICSGNASVSYLLQNIAAIFDQVIEAHFYQRYCQGRSDPDVYDGFELVVSEGDVRLSKVTFAMYLKGPFMFYGSEILPLLADALETEGCPCNVRIQLMDRGTGSLYTALGQVDYEAVGC